MESNWDNLKSKSNYHFDPTKMDPNYDTVIRLGHIESDWTAEVNDIITQSKPATWETRGYKGEGIKPSPEDIKAEHYDLERVGIDPSTIITNLTWKISPCLQEISTRFGMEDVMNRIHVQLPGQLWNLHIDKLDKWCPEDPDRILRVFIQLTDWQQGQFWQYGNYNYSQWKAGEVTTFDWKNVPHSTANAGFHPRITFQITGVKTRQTEEYLDYLSTRKRK